MEVIPVIDLMAGAVVRARLGQRSTYAPIVTPLARTSEPADVVAGLLALYPFATIYVADLDAILRRGTHDDVLDALIVGFPSATFWVDVGVRTLQDARGFLERHERAHLVLGSESLESLDPSMQLREDPRVLLSLDFDGDRLRGPEGLEEAPEHWPRRVIVMTLARIGSNAGPDFERLARIAQRTPRTQIYAAGGLRDSTDLARLIRAGMAGVLVASALHDGRLTRAAIAATGNK